MAVRATQLADNVRKLAGRVTGYIGRCFPFQVYTQLRCYGHGKVVDFMDEGIQKLRAGRSWADKDDGPVPFGIDEVVLLRLGIRETAVVVAAAHQVFRLAQNILWCASIVQSGKHALYIVPTHAE